MGHFRILIILLIACLFIIPPTSATTLVHPLIKEVVFIDIDGDSSDEIVMFTYAIVSTYEDNYIIDLEGNLKGFSYEIKGGSGGIPLPDRVDIDGDGSLEYLDITSDGIVVSDENGTVKWRFNKQIANATASDLDHDGHLEIIYIRPRQYPDMLGVLDSQGNLKFQVISDTLQSEKLNIMNEKEERDYRLKTLALIAISLLLCTVSKDARKFLKPNKQKIVITLFFSSFIIIPPLVFEYLPVLIVIVVSSIVGKNLGHFSISMYFFFGAYLLSCIAFQIFGRKMKFITALIILGITLWVFTIIQRVGGQIIWTIGMIAGALLMWGMFKIVFPLFTIMTLYYIAKMIRAK